MKKFYILALIVTITGLLFTSAVSAQTNTWDGSSSNNWNTAANWSLNAVPTAAHDVVININATINVDVSPTINSLTVSGNATVTLASSGASRTITVDNNGSNIASGSTLTIKGSAGAGTRSMTLAFAAGGTRTISIAGTLIVSSTDDLGIYNATNSATTVTGTLNGSGGTITSTASNLTISSGGTYQHAQNGGTIPTATWNAASTVNVTGITSTVPGGLNGQTFGNFIWNSNQSGTISLEASFTVAGNMTVSQTGAEDLRIANGGTARTVTVNGDFVFSSNSATDFFTVVSGTGAATLNVDGNFTKSGASTFLLKEDNGNAALNIGGDFSMSGGVFDQRDISTTGTSIVTVDGNFSLSGGTYDISGVGAIGVLNVAGDFSVIGTSTFTETSSGSGSVNFTGTTNYTSSGTRFANTINFTVNTGASLFLGANDFGLGSGGTFTLSSGATLGIGHASGITTTGTASNVRNTGTRTYNAGATYVYNGTAAQVTGTGLPATVAGLTFNNTSTGVTLSQSVAISTLATFTDGIVTLGGNTFTVNGGANATGASDASFVNGAVTKNGAVGAGGFDFPIGLSGLGYMPIKIANVAAGTSFTANYVRASAKTTFGVAGLAGLGLQGVSNCEYWTLDRTGASNADITMYWNAHSPCNGTGYVANPPLGLRIVHYNTSTNQWDAHGGGSISGTSTAGSLTWSNVSSFSPFALGALAGSQSSLPVMYDNVKAYGKGTGVQIEWSNLTEREIIKYDVQRSLNGSDFTSISTHLPKSNRNDKADYTDFDAAPAQGTNYYRIKAYEIGGKLVYSKILRVEIGGSTQARFSVYPNPVTGNQVTVGFNNLKQGKYTVRIVNAAGQDIHRQVINSQGNSMTQTLQLPASAKSGMYTMLISGDNFKESKVFIIK